MLTLAAHALGAQNPAASLAGVWGSERVIGPVARGVLVIERRLDGWRATIAGHEAPLEVKRRALDAVFPDSIGRFRGTLDQHTSTIHGFWIQPRSVVDGYGSGSDGTARGFHYATPLTFRGRRDRWTANVSPHDERLSLYFVISARDDGAVTAFLRNPEYALGNRRPFRVTRSGDAVTFTNTIDSSDVLRAAYDSAAGRLTMVLPNSAIRMELTRQDSASPFYPRATTSGYRYAIPIRRNDGWQTGSLMNVRMDTVLVDSLVRRIAATRTTSIAAPYIHSLLIARHGRLVLEEYFHGFDRDRTHDARSESKTFAAALVGAAMLRGARLAPSTRVLALFPEYRDVAHPDARKRRIQLRHLMTMTSGLACDENDDVSPGNEGTMQTQTAQPDWVRFFFDLPMVHDPGSTYAYCSASVNAVGAAVERVTKLWLPDFFEQSVARPLDFGTHQLQLTPTGTMYLGGGGYFLPRDMLKLGQLFLDDGVWNSHRIVATAWAARATRPDTALNAPAEGYHWHLNTLDASGRKWREYEANGNGGQFVIVLPELDLVVGFTAGNFMNYGTWSKFRTELVTQLVIPAVTDR